LTKKRYGMLIDLRRCTGCQTCQMACKLENDVPLGVWRTWVKQIEKGRFPNVSKSFLPALCNNCDNPSCVTVCPTKASVKRDDGIVTIDPHRCIGCRYCMAACPYGMRYIHPQKNIAEKCDWCIHLVEKGELPACVAACPTGALVFGDLNDPESEISKIISRNPVQSLKPEMGNEPHVFYIALDIDVVHTIETAHER
jgi:tetrathionate reductase subunit B